MNLIYTVSMPSTVGTYTNSAQGSFGQATTPTASVTFTVTAPPPLTVVKSSTPYSDPVNGTTNPKYTPGGFVSYTILVTNPGTYTVDSSTIVITDPTPANLQLYVGNIPSGSGPVLFTNGSPSSGLTYTFTSLSSTTDDVDFSNDNGTTWTYVPTPNANGVDPNVTSIRIKPKGGMAAGSNFSLLFNYRIQ